jgi:hypothetical protein
MTMEMLIGMNVGGGVGWVAGGAIGWLGGRNRPSPRWITRVVVLALIAPMVLLGMAAIAEARHGSFGPMIDDARRRERDQLAFSITVATTLSVVTLVAMAAYVPLRRESRGSGGLKGLPDH